MSGGHYDYGQGKVSDLAVDVYRDLLRHRNPYDPDDKLKKETIAEFKKCQELLEEGAIYLQRIDWLLSGDDGEETFHERLREDLAELAEKRAKRLQK